MNGTTGGSPAAMKKLFEVEIEVPTYPYILTSSLVRYLKPFIHTYIHTYIRDTAVKTITRASTQMLWSQEHSSSMVRIHTYSTYTYIHTHIHTYIHTFADRKYNAQYIHIIVITTCLFILHLPIGPSLLLALADDAPGGLKGMLLEVNAAYIHTYIQT